MLTIYTRHAGDCDHHDDMNWRRYRCPKWIRGVLPNGRNQRTAAKTRSWEQAEKYARELEAENDPLPPDEDRSPVRSTIRDAVELPSHCGLSLSNVNDVVSDIADYISIWLFAQLASRRRGDPGHRARTNR